MAFNVLIRDHHPLLTFFGQQLNCSIDCLRDVLNVVGIDPQNTTQSPVAAGVFAHDDCRAGVSFLYLFYRNKLHWCDTLAISERGINNVIDGRPKRNSLKLIKVLLTVNQGSLVLCLNLLNQSVSVLASLQDVLAIFLQTRDTHFDRHILDKTDLISGAWVVVKESQVRSEFIANARDDRVAVVAAKHNASLADLRENSLFKLSYLLEGQLVFLLEDSFKIFNVHSHV